MTFPARHISTSIDASPEKVYQFASNPQNLTKWAAGLSQSVVSKEGDHWIADSPMGKVKVQFAPANSFGVIDHDVTLPNGAVVHNPLRVQKNQDGAEVVFTLYRLDGVSEQEFEADAKLIEKDLLTLKSLIEVT